MPKSLEDRIEERARLLHRDWLVSAGVPEADVGKEILFLLPAEFVRMYQQLWDRVFGAGRSPSGAGGDAGRIKRSGSAKGKGSEMKTRKMSGASGSGKRFTPSPEVVRSGIASDEKVKLDRKLIRAVETALREANRREREARQAESEADDTQSELRGNGTSNHSGRTRSESDKGLRSGGASVEEQSSRGTAQNRRCDECGAFQGPSWKRCPFHP